MATKSKPALAGLELLPYTDEGVLADIVSVANAEFEADSVPARYNVADHRAWFSRASEMFDPARDVTLAYVGNRLVASASREWVDTRDGEYREYRVGGEVDPEWRHRGIGTALLLENERRQRELAATHQTERRRVFGSRSGDTQAGRVALLRQHGYSPVRWFFEMTRPTLDDVSDPPLPDGLALREITPELVHRVWKADMEAFLDHWGGFDDSDATLERWKQSPSFDPSLWVVAFDGEEVAGGVINGIEHEENEALGVQRGWLHSVFTRRPWRRRGIANALIARSLVKLRERGMTSAVLGVDADNPSGALGLYERNAFEVTYRSTSWRKPLEMEEARR
ncbi:MAG: GNAT family N-acetyltransferase [Chloroflexota bacterium]|nr:GNAT family N-acetyltransferase [Chloroflexota bacterium]